MEPLNYQNVVTTLFDNQLRNVEDITSKEGIAPYDMVCALNTCYNFFPVAIDLDITARIDKCYESATRYLLNKIETTGSPLTDNEMTLLGMLDHMSK
jgi:hypothetical protein